MSKIKKITVSNLKAVSKLTADFNGCTAIITGGNNKGKSSFLKSLPERLRGNKPDIVLRHGEDNGFAEWELTTGEKFIWNFDGKKEKLTFITERNIKAPLTKDISSHYFPPIFDVDTFLNSQPAKQRKTLQELTGIDFTELDRLYQGACEDRTFANKRLAEEKAKQQLIDPDLPNDVIPTEDIEKELQGIDIHNLKHSNVVRGINEKLAQVEENNKEIFELENKIASIKAKNEVLNEEIDRGNKWMGEEKNKSKNNAEELKVKIKELKDKNILISENNKCKEQQKQLEKAEANAAAAEAEVKRLLAEKDDVIKNASMPEGFGFSDDGITYNGFAFNKEQLSSSGIYIAALKLAAITLGEVKALHFDASYLDKNSLQEIENWAKENDLQLLIERPDFEGGEIEYQIINNGVLEHA